MAILDTFKTEKLPKELQDLVTAGVMTQQDAEEQVTVKGGYEEDVLDPAQEEPVLKYGPITEADDRKEKRQKGIGLQSQRAPLDKETRDKMLATGQTKSSMEELTETEKSSILKVPEKETSVKGQVTTPSTGKEGSGGSEKEDFKTRLAAARKTIGGYKGQADELDNDLSNLDAELLSELKTANAVYKTAGADIDKKELYQSLIRGFGHIAAGLIGKNTGLNLGGLKFEQKDWDKTRAQALSELKANRESAMATMDVGQKRVAGKRAALAQDTKMQAEEMDRILGQLQHEDLLAIKEATLAETKDKNIKAQMAELAKQPDKKQDLNEYNSVLGHFEAVLQKFKLSPDEHREDLRTKALDINERATRLGLNSPVPSNLASDKDKWWGDATPEEVTKSIRAHITGATAALPTETKDADATKYAKLHNIPYTQAKSIVDKRRAK